MFPLRVRTCRIANGEITTAGPNPHRPAIHADQGVTAADRHQADALRLVDQDIIDGRPQDVALLTVNLMDWRNALCNSGKAGQKIRLATNSRGQQRRRGLLQSLTRIAPATPVR
jgi:hypothetical protein